MPLGIGLLLPVAYGGNVGLGVHRRHRKIAKDNIRGITKPAIRRLARRGGVRRIQCDIYNTIRAVIVHRLKEILEKICLILSSDGPQSDLRQRISRKTITTRDVVFALKMIGTPIYGFGSEIIRPQPKRRLVTIPYR